MSHAERIRAWLKESALPLWAESGFDGTAGAFYERLHMDGTPDEFAQRRVRVQARQIYVYSHAELLGLYPGGGELARRAFETLLQTAQQESGRGFVHMLSPSGMPVDTRLDTYDLAFLILAFAWLYRATGAKGALGELTALKDLLETELRHPSGAGYREDLTGSLPRRQNPHMHLLEAFLAAYGATGDAAFLELAGEMVRLCRKHFFRPEPGALTEFFGEEWHPAAGEAGRLVEPGHQFEWIWLLDQYGRAASTECSEICRALYGFAHAHGLEPGTGLAYDEVDMDGRLLKATKRCWPQTEALKAELAMFEAGGRDNLARANQAVDNLFTYYLDKGCPGGWNDQLGANNTPLSSNMPASTLYHVFLAFAEYLRVMGG